MARVEVPRTISEAPTDRLRVAVKVDGNLHLIPGAQAPTVGQGGGGGTTRTPSAYLLGDRDEASEETTLQIPMRAVVGTPVFDALHEASKNEDELDFDFRTFGSIQYTFLKKTVFEIKAASSQSGFMKNLYQITVPATATGFNKADLVLERGKGASGKQTLMVGGVLEVIKTHSKEKEFTLRETDFTKKSYNPEFIVCSHILYNSEGVEPRAYAHGPEAISIWPNDGNDSKGSIGGFSNTTHRVVLRDQSVQWEASGMVTSFAPGFSEDSALYTLDVTLKEGMSKAKLIHSADVDIANPHYA